MRRGGRIAGYVIHTTPGLSAAEVERAIEFVPMDVHAAAQPGDLAERAGFALVEVADATAAFRLTCDAILKALAKHEPALRAADGDETYEDGVRRKIGVLAAIDEGLIRRTMVAARKS
jgi:hypothetical protein